MFFIIIGREGWCRLLQVEMFHQTAKKLQGNSPCKLLSGFTSPDELWLFGQLNAVVNLRHDKFRRDPYKKKEKTLYSGVRVVTFPDLIKPIILSECIALHPTSHIANSVWQINGSGPRNVEVSTCHQPSPCSQPTCSASLKWSKAREVDTKIWPKSYWN